MASCVYKSFKLCFRTFCNPGTTMVALVGTVSTDSDEVFFLNVVRWFP